VDDLVEALIRLMNAEGIHDPVNLGNPGEFTIKELADEVARGCGVTVRTRYLPLPEDDPQQRRRILRAPSDSSAGRPRSLREGLKPTIAYFARQ